MGEAGGSRKNGSAATAAMEGPLNWVSHQLNRNGMAIINSAAMNIGVHVSLSILVSSVCMPSSGIAESYGSSISSYVHF